ncbi:MAG: microcystin degradation protein MlrC [Planctomycetaceae bacterium]|nr:microcystin degradation protein MlrC [Planctomycetaceae bacterium]
MPNILFAEMRQETASFNPFPTDYSMFRQMHGLQIIEKYQGTKTEISGFMDVMAEKEGIQLIPTMSAASVSGGAIPTEDLQRLINEIVTSMAAVASENKIDAVYMCLHGAMAGETEGDPEGLLLDRVRGVVGDVPLVASIDLHAILTDRMLELIDVVVPFHTYPHMDQYETGQRAANCLLKLMDGHVKPETVTVKLPLLVRGDELITATGKYGEAIRMCQEIEASETGLSAGVNIGNAFTDVPELRTNVLIVRDGDRTQAEEDARRIARFMWEHRELFKAELISVEASIDVARQTNGLTVFSDAADATASGASGDSNEILKALLKSDFERKCLVPIVDQPAVEKAIACGEGGRVKLTLGGTLDPGRFTPLELEVDVLRTYDGHFAYENGLPGFGGQVVILRHQNIDILVVERSLFFVGQKVFASHGCEPADYAIVVVKSPNGFRPYYEAIASQICAVDVIGSTSANLNSLPFKNVARPIFPLDEVNLEI